MTKRRTAGLLLACGCAALLAEAGHAEILLEFAPTTVSSSSPGAVYTSGTLLPGPGVNDLRVMTAFGDEGMAIFEGATLEWSGFSANSPITLIPIGPVVLATQQMGDGSFRFKAADGTLILEGTATQPVMSGLVDGDHLGIFTAWAWYTGGWLCDQLYESGGATHGDMSWSLQNMTPTLSIGDSVPADFTACAVAGQFDVWPISRLAWKSTAGGSWADPENWNAPVPEGNGVPIFTARNPAPVTITLDGPRRVSGLGFESDQSYTLAAGDKGTLSFVYGDGNPFAYITVERGTHTIAAPLIIDGGSDIRVSPGAKLLLSGPVTVARWSGGIRGQVEATGGITVAAGATVRIDEGELRVNHITGGRLVIRNGAAVVITGDDSAGPIVLDSLALSGPAATLDLAAAQMLVRTNPQNAAPVLADIVAQILKARDNPAGKWQGPGITSSLAGDNPVHLALGAIPLEDDALGAGVLVRCTWLGDANLDGIVNADDYFQIDSGFVAQTGGWYNGDFNYDGVTNADDYFLIDSAFIGQRGPMGLGAAAAAVPEPAGTLLLLAAGLAIRPSLRSTLARGVKSYGHPPRPRSRTVTGVGGGHR